MRSRVDMCALQIFIIIIIIINVSQLSFLETWQYYISKWATILYLEAHSSFMNLMDIPIIEWSMLTMKQL